MRLNPYRLLSRYNDARAIRKGPEATVKRQARKTIYHHANRAARKITKVLGL